MPTGMLIVAAKDAQEGSITLDQEIKNCTAIMRQTSETQLVITITFKQASVGEHSDVDIDKPDRVFLSAPDGSQFILNNAGAFIALDSFDPQSGAFKDLSFNFSVFAPNGGKVGGPGL